MGIAPPATPRGRGDRLGASNTSRSAGGPLLRFAPRPDRGGVALLPTSHSGREKRGNIARGFVHCYPLMLLNEPTASLDTADRATVVELARAAEAAGAATAGVRHRRSARSGVVDGLVDIESLRAAA